MFKMGFFYIEHFEGGTDYNCYNCFQDGKDIPITNSRYIRKMNVECVLGKAFIFSKIKLKNCYIN